MARSYYFPIVGWVPSGGRDTTTPHYVSYNAEYAWDGYGPVGLAILAVTSGVVQYSGMSSSAGTGNRIYLKGDDGFYYFYCHLLSCDVRGGQRVAAGQPIGRLGRTGIESVGAHLHISIGRVWQNPAGRTNFNPRPALTAWYHQGLDVRPDLAPPTGAAVVQRPPVAPAAPTALTPPGASGTYTVRSGNSLSQIAGLYGQGWQDLARMNSIGGPRYVIQPGQVLTLPPSWARAG
jgi:hypothetical protein